MFHITTTAVSRTVTVRAEITGHELPADLPGRYHVSTIIRPGWVVLEAKYRDGRWEMFHIEVVGDAVLKSGKTGKNRHNTSPKRDQAPWAFQWADRILHTLNSMPVPDIGGTLVLNLPDLDATTEQP